ADDDEQVGPPSTQRLHPRLRASSIDPHCRSARPRRDDTRSLGRRRESCRAGPKGREAPSSKDGRGERGGPRAPPRCATYDALRAWSPKAAPCGSAAVTTRSPPGTSIGPLRIFPPFAWIRSAAASTSGTRK